MELNLEISIKYKALNGDEKIVIFPSKIGLEKEDDFAADLQNTELEFYDKILGIYQDVCDKLDDK